MKEIAQLKQGDKIHGAIRVVEAPPVGRRRRCRTQFGDAALWRLEVAFSADPYPGVEERETLAKQLGVTEDRIQVWFQNRRSKTKRNLLRGLANKKASVTDVSRTTDGPLLQNTQTMGSRLLPQTSHWIQARQPHHSGLYIPCRTAQVVRVNHQADAAIGGANGQPSVEESVRLNGNDVMSWNRDQNEMTNMTAISRSSRQSSKDCGTYGLNSREEVVTRGWSGGSFDSPVSSSEVSSTMEKGITEDRVSSSSVAVRRHREDDEGGYSETTTSPQRNATVVKMRITGETETEKRTSGDGFSVELEGTVEMENIKEDSILNEFSGENVPMDVTSPGLRTPTERAPSTEAARSGGGFKPMRPWEDTKPHSRPAEVDMYGELQISDSLRMASWIYAPTLSPVSLGYVTAPNLPAGYGLPGDLPAWATFQPTSLLASSAVGLPWTYPQGLLINGHQPPLDQGLLYTGGLMIRN